MENRKLFSASVQCPKCNKAIYMRVSDITEYAYQCLKCDEDFYSIECHKTVSDLYEITLHGQTKEWFERNIKSLKVLCDKLEVSFLGCDTSGKETYIDFGWKFPPSADTIQEFARNIKTILCK